MSGKSTAQKRKENSKLLLEEFKVICPEHRRKDLDSLIKKEKGNKDKISETIQTWWDEPIPVLEEEWEDVVKSKKPIVVQVRNNTSSNSNNSTPREPRGEPREGGYVRDREQGRDRDRDRGGRGYGRSGDTARGGRGYGRGMAGGRGAGPDRRGRGRGEGSASASASGDRAAAERKPVDGDNLNASAADAETFPAASVSAVAVAAAPVAVVEKKKDIIPAAASVKPVTARPLQGAWGQRAAAAVPVPTPVPAPAAPTVSEITIEEQPAEPVVIIQDIVLEVEDHDHDHQYPEEIDIGIIAASHAHDAAPAAIVEEVPVAPLAPPAPKPVAPRPAGGNVWATKGSAHLIRAEKKPVNVAPVVEVQQQEQVEVITLDIDDPLMPVEQPEHDQHEHEREHEHEDDLFMEAVDALDTGLSASVNGANINAAGWAPIPAQEIIISTVGRDRDQHVDAPLMEAAPVEEMVVPVVVEYQAPVAAAPVEQQQQQQSSLKPTSVLNMGHWETGEGDESVSHDFGFGSFGQDTDVASVEETTNFTTESSVSVAATTVSPARPPPGLGIGIGMPPMPENIVNVNELENQLEKTSMKVVEEPKMVDNQYSAPQHAAYAAIPPEGFAHMSQHGVHQQSYAGQYGMGMYNYNAQTGGVAAPNGMGYGVPQTAAPLGVPPQQKQQTAGGLPQQQGSIYGAPAPTAQSNDTNANANGANGANNNNDSNNMPPGMAAGMGHYNPALFYGQQPYQMGQPHGVGAYGFGFAGQYGGVQAGYGYPQQVMGQGAGYGQPYDEQAAAQQHQAAAQQQQQQQHHGGNNHQGGGYNNKNSGGGGGGYRGRNNHQNQYQNQYQPQGYGGQPYNMGYNDHYNQRGGYGQPNMDPYMQNSGGYNQQDTHEHGKAKSKGNNRNNFGNNNPNQNTQQQQYNNQQGGNNQFGGLQGQGAAGASESTSGNFSGWGGGGL
jgi:hypothetical protein